jgi:hypothetical protein
VYKVKGFFLLFSFYSSFIILLIGKVKFLEFSYLCFVTTYMTGSYNYSGHGMLIISVL